MSSPSAVQRAALIAPELHGALLAWYDGVRRDLPWRAAPGQPANAYHVLVSEIMLQQTTVPTVLQRFGGFVQRFSDIDALAAADLDDVLHAWQGLGYYRRARGLHALARKVVSDHGGALPHTVEGLSTLPGIGPYTAAAVAAIAFGTPVLAVDGNVERVLSRLFEVDTPLPAARPELRRLADALAPSVRPGDAAQATMELGALVCRPRSPGCLTCPISAWCAAQAAGRAADLPLKSPKRERPERFTIAFLVRRQDGAVLFRKRPPTGVLASMVELPSTRWSDTPQEPGAVIASSAQAESRSPVAAAWHRVPGSVRHVFTHFALTVTVLRGPPDAVDVPSSEQIWRRPDAFGSLALPSLTKKVLAHAGLA
ncbi:MAG: A/G-specific adenine glycosylase [Pseudomonadota bacterium]